MVQIGEQDIRVIEDFFSKEKPRDFNPLVSPTTPLQFEARQQQQGYDNPWLQNSLQLQLVNYIRSFHGVQPPVESSQQIPQFIHQQQQQLIGGNSTTTVEHHPTITLLQQRFQRLERDREMRHAKQLYSNHHPVEVSAGNFPSTSCSGDCNLQLSLPQGRLRSAASPRCEPGRSYLPSSPTASSRRDRSFVSVEEKRITEAELRALSSPRTPSFPEDGRCKSKLILSLRPSENELQLKSDYKTTSCFLDSSASAAPVNPYCNNGQRETQFLLKDWKSGSGKESLPVAGDDEVDTSLHL